MAVNMVIPLLIPLEENLYNATRLLSESGLLVPLLEFSEPRYCAVLSEDSPLAATILTVSATHSTGVGVRYSIRGGNRDGLFTIHQHSGVITLAAALDHETHSMHELVVAGEGGGEEATTLVQVKVADVNDNRPYFINPQPEVTITEENHDHLPATIVTVLAKDVDYLDHHGLLYTVRGDGVDGYDPQDAAFTINSLTGELIQRKGVDRDPPYGKAVWRVRVQVRDGQALWSRQAITRHLANKAKTLTNTTKPHKTKPSGYGSIFQAKSDRKSRDVFTLRKYNRTKRKRAINRSNNNRGNTARQSTVLIPGESQDISDWINARVSRSDEGGRSFQEWVEELGSGGCGTNETETEEGLRRSPNHLGLGGSRVHVAETEVTIKVKDVNDNPPVFPNATMYSLVQENGPIDLSVVTVAAWDADEDSEGTNAKITYRIKTNAHHDRTGEAIFTIHPETGVVRTAICCLDRETTTHYTLQVMATDGGGLQGTGVVVVRVSDVNDNSPRLEQQLWEVEVDETWGDAHPHNTTILRISVIDHDTHNYFHYRIVESSGWGWQHFGVRSEDAVGHIYATQTLNYEDEAHRRGFRFMVQVTDTGPGGWDDDRHLDTAWVVVRLRDINDNPPHFLRDTDHITIKEDTHPGTVLASFPAQDPDHGGGQKVLYRVSGGWDALSVDSAGGVRLRDTLNHESPEGSVSVARILAVDQGLPPLTSTATLTITLTDVNDTPPFLKPPTIFHVTEDAAPSTLGVLTASDHDIWSLGHGPPFTLSLHAHNPRHIFDYVAIDFYPNLDSGRGGAELRTVASLDREVFPQLLVAVMVADAGGLNTTHTITIVVHDINDNPMKPGAKTVFLWKPQGGAAEAPLGRVYVDDPDDWDLKDKSFRWLGPPHPLFTLNTHTGDLLASSQVREGRYELLVGVSDRLWGQTDVEANVSVVVRVLSPDALTHAAPLTLTLTTPEDLIRGWNPQTGGGRLGAVLQQVGDVLGNTNVEVVSLEGPPPSSHSPVTVPGAAAVWVSVRESHTTYMDPVKLRGLLALHTNKLETGTNLTVVLKPLTREMDTDNHHQSLNNPYYSSAVSRPSTSLTLQVVDTNVTSVVTPRLTRAWRCYTHDHEACTTSTCLNGGQCLPHQRCVCPGGSWGSKCKIVGRTFSGNDWAWVQSLPPCLPLTLFLRVLTRSPHGLLLYSGPLTPTPRQPHDPPSPMLALQLWHSQPRLLVEGIAIPVNLQIPTTVNDGNWHSIHLRITMQGVAIVLDLCGQRYYNISLEQNHHCSAHASWTSSSNLAALATWPLQIGGMAHLPPNLEDHGWKEAPTPRPLDGCISHLRINVQVLDLGEPAYSRGGKRGCQPQEEGCMGGCGHRGQCVGGLDLPQCHCQPGWRGSGCNTPTIPVTLTSSSYTSLQLPTTPSLTLTTVQLRVRMRGAYTATLLSISSKQQDIGFTLYIQEGLACVRASGTRLGYKTVCVESYLLGDGTWHVISAEIHDHSLVIDVDDGDGWRRNESIEALIIPPDSGHQGQLPHHRSPVYSQELTLGGGIPDFLRENLINSINDLQESVVCVDDLRVLSVPVPLPTSINSSRWGEVTGWEGLEPGCSAPDACLNSTCAQPLTCLNNWGATTCSCGAGRQLVGDSCQDVDECLWQPCLHGGSCHNLQPGFQCVCGPGYVGDYCQWPDLSTAAHPLTAPLAITALTLAITILVLGGVVICVRLRQQWFTRVQTGDHKAAEEASSLEGDTILQGDQLHHALLNRLKSVPKSTTLKQGEGIQTKAEEKVIHEDDSTDNLGVKHIIQGVKWSDPVPAKDDLRAYAYEGDGSSADSLSSAMSGMRDEQLEQESLSQMMPGFIEVMDLLKNLPEATRSLTINTKLKHLKDADSKGVVESSPVDDQGVVVVEQPAHTPGNTLKTS